MQNKAKLEKTTIDLADQILRSYYFEPGPSRANRNSDRMIPGVKSAPMRFDFPIFVDLPSITVAGLMLRKMMPVQFGSIPLKKAEDFLLRSVNDYIASFFDINPPSNQTTNYLNAINEAGRAKFHLFIHQVVTAGAPIKTFSFPLSRVLVLSRYDGNNFYVVSGDDVGSEHLESILERRKAKQAINAWIGCSAAFSENAQKTKRIVLGAMSLKLPHIERTQKTLASPADGFVTHNPLTWSTSREHMPPIGYDITLNEDDTWWLDKIDRLLESKTDPDRWTKKAIEYFYLGWFLNENDRVPFNFMTLDALFGQKSINDSKTQKDIGNKRKLKLGVPRLLSMDINTGRLSDLYDLRSQFLHGGSPDIYDSKRYDRYIRKYSCDPTVDIEFLAASCLRRQLFGVDFQMQPNPYETDIQNLKDRGIIPTQTSLETIIQET